MSENNPTLATALQTLAAIREFLIEIHNSASSPEEVKMLSAGALEFYDDASETMA